MSFFNGDIQTNEFVLKPTINTSTLSTDENTPTSISPAPLLIIDPTIHPTDWTTWYIDILGSNPSNGYIMKIIVPRGTHSTDEYLTINFQGKSNHSTGTLACQTDVTIREGRQMEFVYYNTKWFPLTA